MLKIVLKYYISAKVLFEIEKLVVINIIRTVSESILFETTKLRLILNIFNNLMLFKNIFILL